MLSKSVYILFTVIALFLITSCKKEASIVDGETEFSMLAAVNKLRLSGCKCGEENMPAVAELIWNTPLAHAAEMHAKDMYTRNYFEHISPEGSSPIQRAVTAGYTGNTVLENIGKGYKSADEVMVAWKLSESHCKAMMNAECIEMGAYSYNGLWVQEFGK